MNETHTAEQLTAAIKSWMNCLGKGTSQQRAMVAREIRKLQARLDALR